MKIPWTLTSRRAAVAFSTLVLATAGGCSGCSQPGLYGDSSFPAPNLEPRRVVVKAVERVDVVRIDENETLRLSGIGESDHPLADGNRVLAARERLTNQILGKTLLLRPDKPRPVDRGESRGELWEVGVDGKLISVNEAILRHGDGLLDLTRGESAGDERFLTIAREVAAPKSRRAATPLGFQGGIVLPLYSKEKDHDYGPRLTEIKEAGATWVSFLFVWFMDKMEGHSMAPKRDQANWEDNRSAPDEAIVKTIRQAKELGLRVLLLPVVLPWKPGPDDWRGNLRPANRAGFFENYGRFILRYADMAEVLGVDAFSIGSELISLENKMPGDTDGWQRIVRSVRNRFGGRLTYSANWDHYDVLEILDELDFIGMTSYHSLAKDNKEATVDEMVEAWKPIQDSMRKFSEEVQRPMVFTEVGYASLYGINTDPWNYKMETPLDLECQARCYKAFAKAFDNVDFLAGAYFFDWYDDGGPKSTSYSPRGKPAEAVMREYLAHVKTLPPPKHDPAK